MADAPVSAIIQVALQAVVSLAANHVNLVREFPEELKKLDKSAARIRGFLAGADEDKHSPVVQKWLKDLEEEVINADNVLDELNYEILRRKVKYQNQLTKKKVFFCFSFFNKIGFRWRLGSMIRGVNANLERIHRDAGRLGLPYLQVEEAFATIAAGATTSRQTDSTIVRRDVIGRDEDESEIVKKLLTESESVISVIPITGMGGLGKTTLAKAVYKNEQIVGHFDQTMWVCVAEKVDRIEVVFKMILESLIGGKVEGDRREEIVKKIQHELKEKRYFLVLDDVWNDQEELLNDFFSTLAGLNAQKGSWCLVTSRLQKVAIILSRHPQINFTRHELGKLCDDDCWSIMKKWANVAEEVPEDIKEQILRRCDGLPLAARLIGGLLSRKREENWQSILEESLLNGDQGGIEQILKVSFDHLSPAPVKKCFAYCSIFDQDTELEQDLLVELWMAEGFLQPDSQNERMMEKIGYEYLRILLQTSLLEEVKWGRRTWYKMHDLVHDFAKSILNRNSSNQDRYLAVYSSERMVETINAKPSASLRTLFLKGGIADDMLSKFKYLHVLKLFGANAKELPTSIGKLIHLHLLDISISMITTLPESLCKLYCLQTLRIGKLEEGFPKEMSNLISMRHLHYNDFFTEHKIQMPSRIGRWTCLQTLGFFNIGRQEEGRGIQELGTLQDLKGSLEIRNLELVNGKDDAELANLSKKPNMYQLVFEWGNRDEESDKCDEDVLEGLQPHPNLKELQILKFMGDQFPQWFMNLTLTSLVELRVEDCTRCSKLPALGQLPFLKCLYLTGLENTTCIGLSFYSTSAEEDGGSGGSSTISRQTFFPALKFLSLERLDNLKEWKDAHEMRSTADEVHVMDVFPVLETLYISDCPQLTTIPTPSRFPSLDVLEIKENCHVLLVEKVLSNITTLSSLELCGHRQRIESLNFVKRPESSLSIDGCDSLPTDMLVRLCLFPTLQRVELRFANNITTLRGMSCAACLKRLAVFYCDNLRELPEDFYQFQALEYLMIRSCPRINSFGYPNPKNSFGQKSLLKSLEQFTVEGCNALTRLPAEMFESCTSLRELTLFDCPSLVSFPLDLRRTPSLESFSLRGCPNLIAEMPSGFGYLTSLREVKIGPFSDYSVIEFDWAGLASSSTLQCLALDGMPDTKSLPLQLQDLTTITSLFLNYFGAIEALPDWLENLASLEYLRLGDFPKLEYLPSAAAMERLKLRCLRVSNCPLLTERCTPQSGSEHCRRREAAEANGVIKGPLMDDEIADQFNGIKRCYAGSDQNSNIEVAIDKVNDFYIKKLLAVTVRR
nr:putative disease resistance protein RGA3 [Coffea arabica]